ncbi:MAG: class I SAM-dependent methyltransferase [Desulfurococcales archaeon]|nr:class I SAM-dependent methyltransferase [Desulfurococcales archaeon]
MTNKIKDIIKIIDKINNIVIKNSGPYSSEIEEYLNRHRCRIVYQAYVIEEYLDKVENRNYKILEIGPYPGILLGYLSYKGFIVDVIEYPRPEMSYLESVYKKLGVNKIIYHDLSSNSEIETNYNYDIVLMFEVIEHVPAHPVKVMKKIQKIMNKNGVLFISTPNLLSSHNRIAFIKGKEPFPLYNFNTKTTKGHFREYSINELKYILNEANFTIMKIDEMDKEDYCKKVNISINENIKYKIKVKLSRIFFKIIGNNSGMKQFFFVIAYKN